MTLSILLSFRTNTLSQPGLIEQVLVDVGFDCYSKGRYAPVDSILYADKEGPEHQEKWKYQSIIGKFNYITSNTRPDISTVVHQCVHFCTNPKVLHELAVKWIICYLHATKEKGLIIRPSTTFSLGMFVDANFPGMWHKEYAELRDNVLSKTSFIISFCGCPVTLSTTESEYIALSMATRELLLLRRLLQDITTHSFIHIPHLSSSTTIQTPTLVPSKAYEDNSACIVLEEPSILQ